MNFIKKNQELIIAFAVTLLIYFLIRFGWTYFDMPNQKEMIALITGFFDKYGLIIIFLAAIIESILLIGGYFPGSLVIFLGVASSSGDIVRTTKVTVLAVLGMMIGYSIDYYLGRKGGYKLLTKLGFEEEINKIKNKVNKKNIWFSFLLYVIPGSGSLISTSFGILKVKYFKFLFFIFVTVVIWNTLWSILVYNFGMKIFDILTSYVSGVIIICAIFIYYFYSGKFEQLKKKLEQE